MTKETKMDAEETPTPVDENGSEEQAVSIPAPNGGKALEDTADHDVVGDTLASLPKAPVGGVAFAETAPVLPAVRKFAQGKGDKRTHPFFDGSAEPLFEEDATPTLIDDPDDDDASSRRTRPQH